MPIPGVMLDLDRLGTNPDNLIPNEPHTLSNSKVRAVAPQYGCFFADSMRVFDGATPLTRGVHFQCVELHQEATLLFGKEVASVVLLIDQTVSSQVTLTYQAVGDHYSHTDESIANLYNSLVNDTRPIDYTSNIINKPSTFNPSLHRHLLDDLYGFEAIVDYLERIKRAMTLGQTSLVLEIVRALLGRFTWRELPKVLPNQKIMQYDSMLYFLSRRKILSNIWIDIVDEFWEKGGSHILQVDTSGYPAGTTLYIEPYSPTGNLGLFSVLSVPFQTNGGVMSIPYYVPTTPGAIPDPLYFGVKEHTTDDEFKAVTYRVQITEPLLASSLLGFLAVSPPGKPSVPSGLIELYDENEETQLYYLSRLK